MKIDDFRLKLGNKEFLPIIVGGMGVNISTLELAVEAARLGGIGHITDAESPAVSDQCNGTQFVKKKRERFKSSIKSRDKSGIYFDLEELAEAQHLYISKTMESKKGNGAIFVNCMEKLTMANPRETLKTRLTAAMDAGIDGITLSAGLHLQSLSMVKDHARFRDVKFGIIVSSVRALKLFLRRAARVKRHPDYIIVEGPLAGGHIGFDANTWKDYDLKTIVREVLCFLEKEDLKIPVIAAGGIFTGTDGVEFMQSGASAIQVATRFTVSRESGLPDSVKQEYFKAEEKNVVVNIASPTGYPMRMLIQSPGLKAKTRPNCEALGYLLDRNGNCAYLKEYYDGLDRNNGERVLVKDKICLCTHMQIYQCWTCGHSVSRLKDTTFRLSDGSYQLLTAEHIFKDYQFSEDHHIQVPEKSDGMSVQNTDAKK